MQADISWVGVLLAAFSAIVVGFFWYSPMMFVKRWMKETGMTDADMQKMFPKAFPWLIVASLLTAYVLAHFIAYSGTFMGTKGVITGLQTAFWAFLGLGGTAVIAHGVLDKRHPYVMYVNLGNRFVTLMLMGLILGAFM